MGIVNATPDSFSDGGRFQDVDAAIAHGRALLADGADILDIGGESTRPGADPVSPEEEQRRVLPVISALAAEGVPVSVDTRHASTMAAAIRAGAAIVNDVTALTGDVRSIGLVAESGVAVVLMHMPGEPKTMQRRTDYGDVTDEIAAYLEGRVNAAIAAGVQPDRIAVDPGIGFGKTADQNLTLINHLEQLGVAGRPVLIGLSRKSFIGRLCGGPTADRRLGGSLAAALYAMVRGAAILRVHDVFETVQAVTMWRALSHNRAGDTPD